MNDLSQIAAQVWRRVYPDRNSWFSLLPEAREEWIRFVAVTKAVLDETPCLCGCRQDRVLNGNDPLLH